MSKPTHIVKIVAYEVVVPCRPGSIDSPSLETATTLHWDRMPIVLLEAHTDDGVTTLGEVPRDHDLAHLEGALRQLPGTVMAPTPGCQPAAWRPAAPFPEVRHPLPVWASRSPVARALEMISLDWAGQRLGCRMVELLGGAQREQVLVDYWCRRQTPNDLRSIVKKALRLGFTGLKMKSKHGDDVIAQVEAIREVAGDRFDITIDAMGRWHSPNDAMLTLKSLEKFGEGLRIEDPFPKDMPEYWQRARQVCAVPLAWHAQDSANIRRAINDRCADAFNVGGGSQQFLTMAHAVEVAGLSCWHGSGNELGVATVAQLHAAAAARCCVMHSDFASSLIREHTLIDWDWPFKDSHLPLPSGPGLGVKLDRAALDRFTRRVMTVD